MENINFKEFWLTESRNGKLARKNKGKVEVTTDSSGQRELFLYRRSVSVKILLIMSLLTCFMARKFDPSPTDIYFESR
jgi:hypothetical protein